MAIDWCEYTADSIQHWSGGTSQELYIFPATATVHERNFDVRISTATVEVEESTFTDYSGYLRKLLVMEGELTINHLNHHSVELKPFDQDFFQGDWQTTSIGKVRDFNVIYRPHLNPIVEVKTVTSESILLDHSADCFVYVFSGECNFNNRVLATGNAVFCSKNESLLIDTRGNCTIILVRFD